MGSLTAKVHVQAILYVNLLFRDFSPIYLHASGSGVRLYDGPDIKLFILVVGAGASLLLLCPPCVCVCVWGGGGVQLVFFF